MATRPARDPELTRIFGEELKRHLGTLETLEGKTDETSRETVRRTVHALKGSAGLAGEPELAAVMLRIERRARDGEATASTEAVGAVREAIRRLASGQSAAPSPGEWPTPPPDLVPRPVDPIVRAQYVAELGDRLARIDEALARSEDSVDAVTEIYRHVHTMKGAASAAGDEPMAWFCHGLEERIRDGTRNEEKAASALQDVASYRGVLGGLLEDPEAALGSLRSGGRPSHRPPRTSSFAEDDPRTTVDGTIRVAAQSVDRLFDHNSGIAVARERVAARVHGAIEHARLLRRLRADLAEALRLIGPPRPWGAPAAALRRIERAAFALTQVESELDAVADRLKATDQALKDEVGAAKKILGTMRQTPVRGMFARLASAAVAEARRTGRRVTIRTHGADELIDRRLVEALAEPCLQLTRNAVAHGIEAPEARAELGKPREATITFSVKRSGNRLAISIADDGAGVDVAAVRARAVEAGVVTELLAEAADDQTLLELLFVPGFSMRGQSPDLLAGRGVGLDITLAAVQRLGGTIRLASRHGFGFDARVDVPIETGLATVLWVTADGFEHAIPAANTLRIRRVDATTEAHRTPHLAACLEPKLAPPARFLLDLDAGFDAPSPFSVGVDSVGATEEVLVRRLSPLLAGVGPWAGAIVRGDGSLRLAIDVHALAPRARALGRVPEGRISEPPSRPPPSRPPPSSFPGGFSST